MQRNLIFAIFDTFSSFQIPLLPSGRKPAMRSRRDLSGKTASPPPSFPRRRESGNEKTTVLSAMTETGEMTESKRVEMCRKSLKPDKLDFRFCGNDGILDFCFRGMTIWKFPETPKQPKLNKPDSACVGMMGPKPSEPKKNRRFQTASKTAGTMPAVCRLRFRGAGGCRPSRAFLPVRT